MMFYRTSVTEVWVPILASQQLPSWKLQPEFKIGDNVYSRASNEFNEALEKEKMWEKVSNTEVW